MVLKDANSALGVSDGAGIDDIKRAYRQRAKRLHPDRNRSKDASERFYHLTEAYRQALRQRECINVSVQEMYQRRDSDIVRRERESFLQSVNELRTTRLPSRKVQRMKTLCLRGLGMTVLLCTIAALFAEGLYPGSLSPVGDALAAYGIDVSGIVAPIAGVMEAMRGLFG